MLVCIIEFRHPALSTLCRVSFYLKRILTTGSFAVAVHLLIVYMSILVQFVDTTHVAFLSCMYMYI